MRAIVGLTELVSSISTRYTPRRRPGTKASLDFDCKSIDFFSDSLNIVKGEFGNDEYTSVSN